jgi:polysaccharide biosynthesis/export protein
MPGDMLQDMNVTCPIRCGGVGALAVTAVLALLAPMALEAAAPGAAAAPAEPVHGTPYTIQPGDTLTVSVWNEKELQGDVLVRPDGGLSFPLAGDIQASGRTVDDVRQLIEKGLKRYIPDPAVSVAVKQIGGNFIYVIGKVNRPGQFSFSQPLDVMQALALAGGATPYAAVDDIRILHRDAAGVRAIAFHYNEVEKGRNLEQNVLLRSGDTVVVP